MATFIAVYHSEMVITNEIGSYDFVGMNKEIFLLKEFLTLTNMVRLVHERLGWMDEGCEVWFECRIDIGSSNGPPMKTISPVCDEKEWTIYVGVVLQEWLARTMLMMKVLGHRLCPKWLMSSTSNVSLCLLNHRKKLRPALIQRSPHLLAVIKQC
jgi:hypothetical protein